MSFPYLVSVRLMVYNHEFYIREAIDGILKQKTNFMVEVVIGDDFSTDKSLEIIREYHDTATIHFKILDRKVGGEYWQNRQKLGRLHNFYNIIENCTGKYVALLDGDDYWTDPLKLQKQVNFLDDNSDYVLSFHNANYLYLDGKKKKFSEKYLFLNSKNVFTKDDLLKNQWFIPTASILFKNTYTKFPDYFLEVYAGDFNLQLFFSKLGKFQYISDEMSVYRITDQGVGKVNQKPLCRINDLKIWVNLVDAVDKKYILRWTLANYRLLLKNDLKNKNLVYFLNHFFISIKVFFLFIYYVMIHFFKKKVNFKNIEV